MKILMTGADGFVGSWLAEHLQAAGHDVKHARLPTYDVERHEARWFELFDEIAQPDLVLHLAAIVGREAGERHLPATAAVNAGGTALLARAARRAAVPQFCYVSSSEAPLGLNMYGLSKLWGEQAAQLYFPGCQIIRLYMPYGPGHPPGRGRAALTNFLWAAARREPLTVHAGASRPWCWIGDTVRGMRLVLEDGRGGIWNVGRSDNERSMLEVAELACDLTGAPRDLIELFDLPRGYAAAKHPDTTALLNLGWRPEVELGEGMARTLAWLRTRWAGMLGAAESSTAGRADAEGVEGG